MIPTEPKWTPFRVLPAAVSALSISLAIFLAGVTIDFMESLSAVRIASACLLSGAGYVFGCLFLNFRAAGTFHGYSRWAVYRTIGVVGICLGAGLFGCGAFIVVHGIILGGFVLTVIGATITFGGILFGVES